MTQNEVLDAIRSAGYSVYMRNPNDAWCHYTDGVKIGYAQWGRATMASHGSFVHLSTVHKPNKTTGTGFSVDIESITKESLDLAFEYAPSWATPSQRQSVVKYLDWTEFSNASDWNKGYKLVD